MDKIKIVILPQSRYISTEKEAEALSIISSIFGEQECERLKAIGNKKARIASVCGLMALLALDGERVGVIRRGVNGKPYFEDASLGYFSISHSGNVAVAARWKSELGVDVERIDSSRDLKRIADRFFTERELQRFHKDGNTEKSFFKIWTEKEAYVKYLGGTFASLSSKDITGVIFKHFFFESGDGEYIATVCSDKETEIELDILTGD